jgi:hypothetical protein
MKVMLVKSTKNVVGIAEELCQHLSNSSTLLPASFPSRNSRVAEVSFLQVILIMLRESDSANRLPQM